MITEPKKKTADNLIKGISASSGIVIGKAYVLDLKHFCVLRQLIRPDEIDEEVVRFEEAVEASANEMSEIRERAMKELGDDLPFMIFDAHMQILKDPSMIKEVEQTIRKKKCNAEWAIKALLEEYHERFSRIKDNYFRERLQDIDQVMTGIQHNLIHGENGDPMSTMDDPVILVAHDLTPADSLKINPDKIIGIATDVGGKTSHAGIIAASMDIPAVVGLKSLSFQVRTGAPLIVDGNKGVVIHEPTKEQFLEYNKKRQKYLYFDQAMHAQKDLRATTQDDVTIKVMANIESSHDLVHLDEHGAEGVGLYRTEYLYINRRDLPDEDEQYEDYKRVAESVKPNHAVIRTFDLGGDKLSSLYSEWVDPEPNPALGLRAIRFCLSNVKIFKTQLRAILRASHHGKLKVMYPLITALEELADANAILEEAKEELRQKGTPFDENIQVGIMIETPSSVMMASELARHCSFFSIGTNDLIQYTMAIDRVNERVAYLYQPLSPAILRMIGHTIKAADDAGISVSVCGQMAGDPTYAMLLIGFGGVRELSMDVHSVPRLKKFIRSINIKDAQRMAAKVVELGSTEEVRQYVISQVGQFFVDGVSSDLIQNGD